MSEIALISARKNRLETAAKKGNKNAKAALDLANSPNEFLSTVQIGITLIGILTGIYSELLNSIKSINPLFSIQYYVYLITFFSGSIFSSLLLWHEIDDNNYFLNKVFL